jgi:hypothetical protein
MITGGVVAPAGFGGSTLRFFRIHLRDAAGRGDADGRPADPRRTARKRETGGPGRRPVGAVEQGAEAYDRSRRSARRCSTRWGRFRTAPSTGCSIPGFRGRSTTGKRSS